MRTATVTIEGLSYGGKGVGSITHKGTKYSIFVPYTAPGDKVRVQIVKKNKRYWEGEILDILTPSKHRRKIVCEHFKTCGGCHFLHLDDQVQREAKIAMLAHIFKDFDCNIEPCIEDNPFFYRNRATFQGEIKKGKMKLGLHSAKSHDVVDIDHCPLMQDDVNYALGDFRDASKRLDLPDGKFKLEVIIDRLNIEPHFTLHISQRKTGAWEHLDLINLTIMSGSKALLQSENACHVYIPGEKIGFIPPLFTQVNPSINRKLILYLLHQAKLKKTDTVLDLYCGFGNFTFPLASKAKSVFGIESSLQAIVTARLHADYAGKKNVEFTSSDAILGVKKLIGTSKKFDVVVLDPPRAGVGKEVEYLAKLEPRKILYVSCHPRNLARDARLLEAKGYTLATLTPFEMFPQTFHIETLAVFERVKT